MKIVMIAAVAENRVLAAADDSLPWRLPEDLKRFKRVTLNHPVIMGRKTFGTLPGSLKDRTNIVLSRKPESVGDGAIALSDPDEALDRAKEHLVQGQETVFIVGGAEVYSLYMDRATHLDLTRVHATPDGVARFPSVDPKRWRMTQCNPQAQPERHSAAFDFEQWEAAR